jgi:hypothetical protein
VDLLNEQQIALAIKAMNEYISASNSKGKAIVGIENNIDQKREQVIESELKPLLNGYLSGNLELSDFKSKVDSINKKNELWGFKGIKGQMFLTLFSMLQIISMNAMLKLNLQLHCQKMSRWRLAA